MQKHIQTQLERQLETPTNTDKSFIIVLGDTGNEFRQYLALHGGKRILKNDIWLLAMTNKHNYWIVDEKVKNLRGEFMHFTNPEVYILANYKSNSYLTILEQSYNRVKEDLILSNNHKPQKITVIGMNYKKNLKSMKLQVLQWCEQNKVKLYHDFDDITEEL